MAVGIPPGTGPQLVDGAWLTGVAAGLNNTYIYGLIATGTTQANATPILPGYYLVEADTVAAGTGLTLASARAVVYGRD